MDELLVVGLGPVMVMLWRSSTLLYLTASPPTPFRLKEEEETPSSSYRDSQTFSSHP